MNDNILRIISPDIGGLTGERRAAFFKQMFISFAIILVMVPVILIAEAANSSDTPVLIIGLLLFGVQLIYAFFKGELLWQLKLKERRLIAQDRKSNEQELTDYAHSLENSQSVQDEVNDGKK
jgi:hypothetical protein